CATAGAGVWIYGAAKPSGVEQPEEPAARTPAQAPAKVEPGTMRADRFGDPLPAGALARLGTVRLRQGAPVDCLAFSPDSKVLAPGGYFHGGEDRSIYLWDVATGKELCRLVGHEHSVTSVDFSPDGKVLASGGEDGTIRLWDVTAGKELRRCGEKPLP